ncbi:hypothetical protein [Pseudonocardia petroleophila]
MLGVETAALKAAFDISEDHRVPGDGFLYYEKILQTRFSGQIRLRLHPLGEAGNVASAADAARILNDGASFMLLCGIAAGRRGKVKIGDVIVPRAVVDTTIKVVERGALIARPSISTPLKGVLQMNAAAAGSRSSWEAHYQKLLLALNCPPMPARLSVDERAEVASVPTVHDSAILSDNLLLRDPDVVVDAANRLHQQIRGGEMEAAGFVKACETRYPPTPWFIVRSVSDFGDELKDDSFHVRAAASTAAYAADYVHETLDLRIWTGLTGRPRELPSGEVLASSDPMQPLTRDPVNLDPISLGVHPSIASRAVGKEEPPLPVYISRGHDLSLGEAILNRARPRLILLVGPPATGKTRSMYEALKADLSSGYSVLHPVYPSKPAGLLNALERLGGRTILWLDEFHEYLQGSTGSAVVGALHNAMQAQGDLLILGTLWNRSWQDLAEAATALETSVYADAQILLNLATRIDVLDHFDSTERSTAERAAIGDTRIALALKETGSTGKIAQYLAGGIQAAHRYRDADTFSRALVDAAIDAVRLSPSGRVSIDFLRDACLDYIDGAAWPIVGDDKWFTDALRYCTFRLRNTIALLEPVRHPTIPNRTLYTPSSYIREEVAKRRQFIVPPESFWDSVVRHEQSATDVHWFGIHARRRGLSKVAARLFMRSCELGGSSLDFAEEVLVRAGHHEAVLQLWRDHSDLDRMSDEHAAYLLASIDESDGMAEKIWKQRSASGSDAAECFLAELHSESEKQLVERIKQLASIGNAYAARFWMNKLQAHPAPLHLEEDIRARRSEDFDFDLLTDYTMYLARHGRYMDAEVQAARGLPYSRGPWMSLYAYLDSIGRYDLVQRLLVAMLEGGDPRAAADLAEFYEWAGDLDSAVDVLLDSKVGLSEYKSQMLSRLVGLTNRVDDLEARLRDGVERGDALTACSIATARFFSGDLEGAAQAAEEMVQSGKDSAIQYGAILFARIGQLSMSEETLNLIPDERRCDRARMIIAEEAGDSGLLDVVVRILGPLIAKNDIDAIELLAWAHAGLGDRDEAIRLFRQAVSGGTKRGFYNLMDAMNQLTYPGWSATCRYGLNYDGTISKPW